MSFVVMFEMSQRILAAILAEQDLGSTAQVPPGRLGSPGSLESKYPPLAPQILKALQDACRGPLIHGMSHHVSLMRTDAESLRAWCRDRAQAHTEKQPTHASILRRGVDLLDAALRQ